jgi:hypothetical protein
LTGCWSRLVKRKATKAATSPFSATLAPPGRGYTPPAKGPFCLDFDAR